MISSTFVRLVVGLFRPNSAESSRLDSFKADALVPGGPFPTRMTTAFGWPIGIEQYGTRHAQR